MSSSNLPSDPPKTISLHFHLDLALYEQFQSFKKAHPHFKQSIWLKEQLEILLRTEEY